LGQTCLLKDVTRLTAKVVAQLGKTENTHPALKGIPLFRGDLVPTKIQKDMEHFLMEDRSQMISAIISAIRNIIINKNFS